MSEQKFKIGTEVFFDTMINHVPGVIHDAVKEHGNWYYDIRVGSSIVKNVMEHYITVRNEFPEVMYKQKDIVRFTNTVKGIMEIKQGEIAIIDYWGTFEQDEEPSYDILVTEEDGSRCLWKHVRQSSVIELVKAFQE